MGRWYPARISARSWEGSLGGAILVELDLLPRFVSKVIKADLGRLDDRNVMSNVLTSMSVLVKLIFCRTLFLCVRHFWVSAEALFVYSGCNLQSTRIFSAYYHLFY